MQSTPDPDEREQLEREHAVARQRARNRAGEGLDDPLRLINNGAVTPSPAPDQEQPT